MVNGASRSQTEHPLLDYPVDLPTNQIPTCLDIVKCYLFLLHDDKQLSGSYDQAKVIANQVRSMIKQVFYHFMSAELWFK